MSVYHYEMTGQMSMPLLVDHRITAAHAALTDTARGVNASRQLPSLDAAWRSSFQTTLIWNSKELNDINLTKDTSVGFEPLQQLWTTDASLMGNVARERWGSLIQGTIIIADAPGGYGALWRGCTRLLYALYAIGQGTRD